MTESCLDTARGRTSLRIATQMLGLLGLLLVTVQAAPPVPARLPTNSEAAAALLATAGEGFRIRETDHFTIAYGSSYEAVRPLVGRLEGTYDAVWEFCHRCRLEPNAMPPRLQVILFDQYEAYTRYAASLGVQAGAIAGFYHQHTNIAAFCNTADHPALRQIDAQIDRTAEQLTRVRGNRRGIRTDAAQQLQRSLATLRSQREEFIKQFNQFVLQHESVHQVLFNVGVHVRRADNPTWLVEGLACQFEVTQAGRGGELRRVNHLRLADFRDALSAPVGQTDVSDEALRTARNTRRFLPITELISEPERLRSSDVNLAFYYAQAWALVYYLHNEHSEAFSAYVRKVRDRKVQVVVASDQLIEEFRAAFGEPDATFERAWIDYMLGIRFDHRAAGQ